MSKKKTTRKFTKAEVEAGREAAVDQLTACELCFDLAGEFARESARKRGDAIGDVRDNYESITIGLRATHCANVRTAIVNEYARDRKSLMRFLSAVFNRWQNLDKPDSLFRQRLMTQQHLGKPKVVAQYLENIGAVSPHTTQKQTNSLRDRIKQYRTRDRKNALKKRQKAR
jgi:hypothetical protein